MKNIWNIVITILLFALIAVTLIKNKNEIDLKVKFAEQEVQVIPVRVAPLETDRFVKEYTYTEIIKPTVSIHVNVPLQGRILEIFVKEGSQVNQQTTLFKVDDEYLRAEYQIDKQNYELAKKNLNRLENLSEENAITGQQLDEIENKVSSAEIKKGITEKRLNETWVKSPVKGRINQIFVKKGMLINPSVPLCEIVDISKFKVNIKVTEEDIVHFKEGQKVFVRPHANTDTLFNGTIKFVSLSADFALQYNVEVEFLNNTNWIRGGMTCDVILRNVDEEVSKIIPKNSVINKNDSTYIFVVEDEKALKKKVIILDENETSYKIVGDVNEGDLIIYEGQSKLQHDYEVKIIES